MIRVEQLPPEVAAKVLARDAQAMKAAIAILDPLPPPAQRSELSEKEWTTQVGTVLTELHWLFRYHPVISHWSRKGWPDWTYIRPPRMLFVELKTDRHQITADQARVITLLRACDQEVYIWRPATGLEEVARILASKRRPPERPLASNELLPLGPTMFEVRLQGSLAGSKLWELYPALYRAEKIAELAAHIARDLE
jgi:hypothetical protein